MAAAAWFCLRHFPSGLEGPYPGHAIRYATGAQYQWSDRLSTGAQFVYADYGKAKIDNDLLKGDYKRNDILFFALNANWKF